MRFFLFFLIIIVAYSDVSDIVIKIKEIQNRKKVFLNYPRYNIFIASNENMNIQLPTKTFNTIKENLKIYAIFNDKVNINGKWRQVGDFINGYRILAINPTYIVLKKDNKIKILKFISNILKVSK